MIESGQHYHYQIIMQSSHEDIQISALELPSFLALVDNTIQGTASSESLGMHRIAIQVNADDMTTFQYYLITVQEEQVPPEAKDLNTPTNIAEDDTSSSQIQANGGSLTWYFLILALIGLRVRRA